MKNSIKKIIGFILIVISFMTSSLVIAQELKGKVSYISKAKAMPDFEQRQLSEAQKARIKERQGQASTKTHTLIFDNHISLFLEEPGANQNIQQTGGRNGGGGFRRSLGDQNSGTFYKDIDAKKYVTQKDMFGKQFLINDQLKDLNWQNTDEVKTIGKYLCFKATATLPKVNTEDTETTVTAWYTIEVPISSGPELFWGLPGLILELHTPDIVYLCSKIELNLKDSITINAPKKGKKVSQEKYDVILAKKAKELKELQQNRRSGSGGRRN